MDEPKTIPNPGSKAAIEAGCTCPVLDNAHGRGYMGRPGLFVFTGGCPVHFPHVGAGDYGLAPTPPTAS